jgi:hypothetical protein
METIIAGRFETLAAAKQAEAVLIGREFAEDDICSISLNPPGQHDTFPIGGDNFADKASEDAGGSAVKGGAIGGAIGLGTGLAAASVIPPAGIAVAVVAAAAGVGAYTGALAGGLKGMGSSEKETKGPDPVEPQEPRAAGVLVAVRAENASAMQSAQDVLRDTGASDIEIANGTWRNGTWTDFDPQTLPINLEKHQ